MNELSNYISKEFGEIRGILINEVPYLVGKDVCVILGYSNPSDAIKTHVDNDDKILATSKTQSDFAIEFDYKQLGQRGGWLINESGFYSLVFGSELPKAKQFKKWVASEVLPSIRKHGMYATPTTVEAMLNDPDTMIQVLTELKAEREHRIQLEKENASLLPDANMARDIIKYSGLYTLKEVADLIESGRTELCTLLRLSKVLSKQTGYNLPLNKYIKQGYFKIKIREKYNTPVTLVTARGLKFIYRLIKKYDMMDEFDTDTLLEVAKDTEVA